MTGGDYWRRRMEVLAAAELKKADRFQVDLDREYRKAVQALQREIDTWYGRFMANHQVSLAEAKRLLNSRELEEFRWTVEDYIKAGEENALDGRWMKQLENASARVHISRLEALQFQLQERAEELFSKQQNGLTGILKGIYEDGYYRTAFELQKGLIGSSFARLDTARVEKVLTKPWAADGSDFSSRIWKDKQRLVNDLHTGLTQAMIRGDPPDKLAADLSKRFGVSKSRAFALVQTESAAFAAAAQKDCFKELGVEQYEVVGTLDRRTCEICGGMDGKIFAMSEFEPGTTAPPFHTRCRCCTAPYFEDETGKRAARDEGGKTYYVPQDMNYRQWKTYTNAVAEEPKITKDLEKVIKATGGTLEGLDFRIKTPESFIRKVNSDTKEKAIKESAALSKMYDIVRFTGVFDGRLFGKYYYHTVEKLKQEGYNIIRVKNTLENVNAPYRGINTIIETRGGFKFELQFHTKESLAAKEAIHPLYEKARADGTDLAEVAKLAQEMAKISAAIPVPTGAETIVSFDMLK